ncbi:MAG: hypothetical protein JWP31_1804 [Aeromicrobium sp.]|nr:hypothetical protein [Aeromicrobium sp.]
MMAGFVVAYVLMLAVCAVEIIRDRRRGGAR